VEVAAVDEALVFLKFPSELRSADRLVGGLILRFFSLSISFSIYLKKKGIPIP
jgi:hypothetical protein